MSTRQNFFWILDLFKLFHLCIFKAKELWMRADMKSRDRGRHQLQCWNLSAAGPEVAAPLPSSGRQIKSSLEKAWERKAWERERGRERNNRFQLNSLLSLILFELTANFACLRRPTPLSQKSPALPTSNPCAQPVEPTPAHRLDCLLQNKGQSWRREFDPLAPVITCGIRFFSSAACVKQF